MHRTARCCAAGGTAYGTGIENKTSSHRGDRWLRTRRIGEPKRALEEAGAKAEVISPKSGKVEGWKYTDWGTEIAVDREVRNANPDDYDALMLPGGQMNPDNLRMDESAVRFIESFVRSGKPIAAICHGPLTLIEAGGVKGRRMTSYPSIRTDLRNAGAEWVDEEVVTDHGLVTSRKPDDIPAFNRKMIEEFAAGRHEIQRSSGSRRKASQAFAREEVRIETVKEGTFAGSKDKLVQVKHGKRVPENTGDQAGGQN
jgi:protease I